MLMSPFRRDRMGRRCLLGGVEAAVVGATIGGAGKCERISVRRFASDLSFVEMKTSMSKEIFLLSVANAMRIILLFEIYLIVWSALLLERIGMKASKV